MAKTEWRNFRKYHYLTHDLSESSQCYGLFDGENLIGFCAVLHFPHPKNKKIKHCHRLVILPDYQGIGLGIKFLTEVAKIYAKQGYDFGIITSARNLMAGLASRKEWLCQFYGHQKSYSQTTTIRNIYKNTSAKRITASFYYNGEKGEK